MNVNQWGPLNTWQESTTTAPADCIPWIGSGWVAGCEEQIFTLGWICCAVPVVDEEVHPPGTVPVDADIRRWILEEDDMLLAVIMAFLRIKDD